mgnify:FL=1
MIELYTLHTVCRGLYHRFFPSQNSHLSELAIGFPGLAKPESHYKRQQRFFRAFEMDYDVIAQLVVAWMAIPEPWVLAVDRTQWD